MLLVLLACGGADGADPTPLSVGIDLGDADIYDWRSEPCEPFDTGLLEPVLESAEGDVQLSLSSNMQAVGYAERIGLRVVRSGTDTPDADVAGDFAVESDPALEVVEREALMSGSGAVLVRFLTPGRHDLRVRLLDGSGREGRISVLAYRSQLQVWQMQIAEAELDEMLGDPGEDIVKPAQLLIDGKPFAATVRLHGGSSRTFPKPSFHVKLQDGELADHSKVIVLRAEYGDKTMLRNYLGSEVFRYATGLSASRMRMVHLRVNGEFYGVMWHVEHVDPVYLRARGLSAGSLYEADPSAYSPPGGNLTRLPTLTAYQAVYDQKSGPAEHADLIALIEGVIDRPHDEFMARVEDELDVESYLQYLATMAVLQNQDHVRKNYYLYRDTTNPRFARWTILPWDLDLAMGHLWTEEYDVLDETLFTQGTPYAGKKFPEHEFFNRLMDQVWSSPAYDEVFWGYIRQTLQSTFTQKFIGERIDAALCHATADILADPQKRADNSEYAARVEELRDFIDARRAYLTRIDPYAAAP
jgi:spore coat protein H